MAVTFSLISRELLRFVRQPSRWIASIGTPLLFWFLLGSGVGNSFQGSGGTGTDYLTYFFPGTLAMLVMFTSIFSTISVIEDRREGFLQSAMVAPVSRGQIVISKVWGGSLLALLQVILLVPLIFLIDLKSSWINVTLSLAVLFLLANALTALSFFFAWKLNSIQGFHGVMNLILFPMWFLSGALFPATSAPTWLRSLMWVNPMSHALSLVRDLLSHPTFESQSFLIPLSSLFLTAGCFYLLSVRTVSQSQEKSV